MSKNYYATRNERKLQHVPIKNTPNDMRNDMSPNDKASFRRWLIDSHLQGAAMAGDWSNRAAPCHNGATGSTIQGRADPLTAIIDLFSSTARRKEHLTPSERLHGMTRSSSPGYNEPFCGTVPGMRYAMKISSGGLLTSLTCILVLSAAM